MYFLSGNGEFDEYLERFKLQDGNMRKVLAGWFSDTYFLLLRKMENERTPLNQ